MPPPSSQVMYVIGQGATLEAPFTVAVNGEAVDITNSTFRSTLKTDYSIPDTDPTVVMIDWTGNGGSNPRVTASGLGQTVLVVPDETTRNMAVGKWYGQVRGEDVPNLPAVTDLYFYTLDITQVVSSR
jgi:hypothetical protein